MFPGIGFRSTAGDPPPIALSPANPGTLVQSSPGAGATWDTTVMTSFASSFSWVVRKNDPPNFTYRTSANNVTPNAERKTPIKPHFVESGDFLHLWKSDQTSVEHFTSGCTLA